MPSDGRPHSAPASEPSPPTVDAAAFAQVMAVLQKLNASNDLHQVLGLINDSVRDCLKAERASVFQFDPKTQELVLNIAHGVKDIRLPINGKGLAAEAARTRQIINVHDAWEDPRFNPEFDKKNNFRTRGLLTVPLVSFDGGLQGVVQALNKNPQLGPFFSESDEFVARALADTAAIALRRAALIEAEIRKKKIEGDLAVARTIQQASLPKNIPQIPGYDVAAHMSPADETGGDTFDVLNLAEFVHSQVEADRRGGGGGVSPAGGAAGDQAGVGGVGGAGGRRGGEMSDGLFFLMGDATGHGIGPALSVAQARAMVRMGVRQGATLDRIAWELNAQLCEDLPAGRFITAFLGHLVPAANEIRYVAPGQAPLLVLRASGELEEFSANAMPLGIDIELHPDPVEPLRLNPGDLFLLLSDGFLEAQDPDGEQFGVPRAVEAVRAVLAAGGGSRDILAALQAAVRAFARGRPFGDDQTAVIVLRQRI